MGRAAGGRGPPARSDSGRRPDALLLTILAAVGALPAVRLPVVWLGVCAVTSRVLCALRRRTQPNRDEGQRGSRRRAGACARASPARLHQSDQLAQGGALHPRCPSPSARSRRRCSRRRGWIVVEGPERHPRRDPDGRVVARARCTQRLRVRSPAQWCRTHARATCRQPCTGERVGSPRSCSPASRSSSSPRRSWSCSPVPQWTSGSCASPTDWAGRRPVCAPRSTGCATTSSTPNSTG